MKTRKDRMAYAALFFVCFSCMLLPHSVGAFAKQAPKKLVLSEKRLSLREGERKKLSVVSVKPKKALKKVIWKSKDKTVATVSAKGAVFAKKEGKTVITAISKKNPKVKKSIRITVSKAPASEPPASEAPGTEAPESKPAVKEAKELSLQCGVGVYDIGAYGTDFVSAWQGGNPELYGFMCKGHKVIASEAEYQELIKSLKENGCANYGETFVSQLSGVDYKESSIVLIGTQLNYPEDMKIVGIRTKLDDEGTLHGEVDIQYRDGRDPEYMYPCVMTDCVTILKLDKEDAGMIEDYACHPMEVSH